MKEFLLFAVPGALVVFLAFEPNIHRWLGDPVALLLGVCGALAIGFGLLPPMPRPAPKPVNPRSKRRQD